MQTKQGSGAPSGAILTFLIADIRGYTVFSAEQGDEAAARLASRFATVVREGVEAHGGELTELRGDEALVVFDSARQAIRAAIDLQRRFVDETVADPKLPLPVGIGLDAGEAVPVEDGYRGGALNLAARLCSLAGPAEVLASREVVHLARKVEGVTAVDRGSVRLKGLPEPVQVIRLRAEAQDASEDTAFRRALGPSAARLAPAVPGVMVANPYKGLRAFEEGDAPDFFGREELTGQLVERLGQTRFLAVVGPSGSGKSSVVRAGLIPAIRGGALPDSSDWLIAEMLPGAHPLDELEAALLRVAVNPPSSLMEQLERDDHGLLRAAKRVLPADDSELLLLIDQFEEVFTLVADEAVRTHFLESLEAAVADPHSRLRVVVTLRADFYDRPLLYRGFAELLRSRVEVVIPLSPEELERAISKPAERVDVRLEQGLVAEMLGEVADEPGGLPLMQYALTELFERRDDHILTLDAYRAVGGVSGALGRRAEELFGDLDEEGEKAARQLFLRMVALGEGTEDTRRPVPRPELDSLDLDQRAMTNVIDSFGTSRLLSFDRDSRTGISTVELAHEALLTAWGRLRRWIDEAREDLRTERRLAGAAREWLDADRDPSFLVTGSRLDQFESWRQGSSVTLTPEEREFVETSLAERDQRRSEEEAREQRERELERRSVRRLRTVVVVLAIAALLAGGLTVFAFVQQGRAERERRFATARELAAAAAANLDVDPERSILLALEAIDRTRSIDGDVLPEAEEALHRAVIASRIELSVPGVGGAVDWSPEGVFVTEGPEDTGVIDIRDASTGETVLEFPGHDIDVNDVQFSPDGSMLATGGDDGALKVWDPSTGDLLSTVQGDGAVWGPSFSGDGALVSASWEEEGIVRIADPSSGRIVHLLRRLAGPFDTALSPDGRRVAVTETSSQDAVIVDVASDRTVHTLRGHRYGASGISWSPDGRWIATAGNDASVRIWDPATGRTTFELIGHTGVATTTDWSPDSRRLVSGGSDGAAKIWEVEEDGAREVMSVSALETSSGVVAAFAPDGTRVITGDMDITAAKIWDVSISGDAEVANIPTEFLAPVGASFLPDGRIVAPIDQGSAAIWEVPSGEQVLVLGPGQGSPEPVVQVAASPDGTRVATVRNFASVADVWDTMTGQRLYEANVNDEVTSIDWSDDGEHLVVGSFGGLAVIFDDTGAQVQVLEEDEDFDVDQVAFSPDGRLVATSVSSFRRPLSGQTSIWDWERGEPLLRIPQPRGATAMDFDPAGSRIAVAHDDSVVEVFDVDDGASVLSLPSTDSPVNDLLYNPDGSRIAVGNDDGTVRLFDAESGNQLLILQGHDYLVSGLSFGPDGRTLASASPDAVVRIWALDLDELIRIAGENVTRTLTDKECRQYLHGPCP